MISQFLTILPKQFKEKTTVFLTNSAGTIWYPHPKLGPSLMQYTKTNSKWTTYLHVRAKMIKFLKENIDINFHDLGISNSFSSVKTRALAIKEISKLNFIKIKNFYASKDTIESENPQNGRKYLQIIYKKGLISRIYNEHPQLNNRSQATQFKIGQRLNRHFSEEDSQMANNHKKRCSTSSVIKEIQIKTTRRCHFISSRMAKIKKNRN